MRQEIKAQKKDLANQIPLYEYLSHAGRKWKDYKHYTVTTRDDFDFLRFPTQALLMSSVWSTELIIERIEVCFD